MQLQQLSKTTPRLIPSSYEPIASEYYNARAHPTCANFRVASAIYIRHALRKSGVQGKTIDVGAGRSLAAELFIGMGLSISELILLDGSAQMLAHSDQFIRSGIRSVVGNAELLPLRSANAGLMITSLGDAFNTERFWAEAARCIRYGGACIFTSPSYQWAHSFRSSCTVERPGYAFFELLNDRSVYVPSIVYPSNEQINLIQRNGFAVVDVRTINADAVPPPHSTKIAAHPGIVSGYLAIRT